MSAPLRLQVEAHLSSFDRLSIPLEGRLHAAVALALTEDEQGHPSFILTRRTPKLKKHSGQWALPGGRIDAGEGISQAALRELHEEVGLSLPRHSVLGLLDDYPTRSGFVITPVVVWVGRHTALHPNPHEVALAKHVPISELDHPEVPVLRNIPESDRPLIALPLLGDLIHAPTAAILYQLREVAIYGRRTRVADYEQPVFAWK